MLKAAFFRLIIDGFLMGTHMGPRAFGRPGCSRVALHDHYLPLSHMQRALV